MVTIEWKVCMCECKPSVQQYQKTNDRSNSRSFLITITACSGIPVAWRESEKSKHICAHSKTTEHGIARQTGGRTHFTSPGLWPPIQALSPAPLSLLPPSLLILRLWRCRVASSSPLFLPLSIPAVRSSAWLWSLWLVRYVETQS